MKTAGPKTTITKHPCSGVVPVQCLEPNLEPGTEPGTYGLELSRETGTNPGTYELEPKRAPADTELLVVQFLKGKVKSVVLE